MKFSTREDIEAPIDFVFAAVSDFDTIEKQILRRGVKVRRVEQGGPQGEGMAWEARVPFRGRMRDVTAHVTAMEPPTAYRVASVTGGINGDLGVELVALSRQRTRLVVGLEITPSTLSARLLVQSMKFAKGNLQKRFARRVAKYAAALSERYSAA